MIAVMQPYIFPYLGYFQLIMASDIFVLFDDVNYIKKGYINRNSILFNNCAHRFTLPVLNVSQNKHINEHYFSTETDSFFKTLKMAYCKAPYYKDVICIVEKVLLSEEKKVSVVCFNAIKEILQYIGIDKKVICSSTINYDRSCGAADKIISITKILKNKDYVNAIGGRNLYDTQYFNQMELNLYFLKMNEIFYTQGKVNAEFVPNLSILDALMWLSPSTVRDLLQQYSLVQE
ncbi:MULTISPECIES: WbqC family protein [Citrobacter]|uniref:WbqC family protein n=1 Tax=Citrobacter TaxID=544 RepID=UPI000B8E4E37|nr:MULTISPECIES: WbqC family protein [Citrobacter]EGT5654425.1 WbqC family protein [Citrobacter braakii]MBA8129307.1 WbqC family protein [Citrobacter sp. RHBSTW-00013]